MDELKIPCETCATKGDCRIKKGCYQWQCWFREYWRRLRKQWMN